MIGDIPDDWETIRLVDALRSHLPGDWGEERGDHLFKVLRSTNLTNDGPLDLSNVATRALPKAIGGLLQPKKYDLLLERSGGGPDQPVGRVGIIEQDMPGYAYTNFLHLLRPNPVSLDPRYLGWVLFYLNRTGIVLRLEQQTTGMRNLLFQDYLDIELPKPPKGDDTTIARILDAAQTAIITTQLALETMQRLKRGFIQNGLQNGLRNEATIITRTGVIPRGWSCKRFGDLIADGPTNGLYCPESDYHQDGTPIVRIDSFDDGELHGLPTLRRVRVSDIEQQRYALQENDLLINRVNSLSHIGKAALVPRLTEDLVFESNIMRLRLQPDIDPHFVILVLCSDKARRHWLARAKPAVNQASINQQDVRSLWVPIPTPEEQRRIIRIATAIDHSRKVLLRTLDLQQRLKRGLLQDLLTGRIRVGSRTAGE
jgi:type I restriction enzyme S subunit